MSLLPFVALLLPVAHAGTPVVFEGQGGQAAVREVVTRTGLPPDQLVPLDIATLVESPPQVVGDAVLRRCVREPEGMESVRAELARAASARLAGDLFASLDHLDLAVAGLGCLDELVDGPVAAQIFLQRGAILAARGELDASRSELRTALSFDPELPWDTHLPGGAEDLLEEERSAVREYRVDAAPSGLVSGPWLGGQVIAAEGLPAASGLILAQYSSPAGIRTAWLVVSGDATLLVPEAYRPPLLPRMVEADGRRELGLLLGATVPDFVAAYVHDPVWGTWLVVDADGEPQISELVPAQPPPEPAEQPRRWWQRGR